MGLYPIDCPQCKTPFMWFSSNFSDQRCAKCKSAAPDQPKPPPIATNTGWPYEKKLHERIAELERERDRAIEMVETVHAPLRAANERIAELERHLSIKESRESQFDSTLKATMAERDRLRAALMEILELNALDATMNAHCVAREALAPRTGRNPSDSEIAGPRE